MVSETHGGDEVLIYAQGPWAHLFHGLHEENYIAHVIKYAACIGTDDCHAETKSSAQTTGYILSLLVSALFHKLLF